MKNLSIILSAAVLLAGCCTAKKSAGEMSADNNAAPRPAAVSLPDKGFKPAPAPMPSARIYKIDAAYASLVPVTVSGTSLISYPAPSDVTSATAPVELADGWWLDRAGIGSDTRFLRWTRSEYHDLSETPSPSQIEDAIIPGARPSRIVTLPLSAAEAAADTAAVNALIRRGLPGCTTILP